MKSFVALAGLLSDFTGLCPHGEGTTHSPNRISCLVEKSKSFFRKFNLAFSEKIPVPRSHTDHRKKCSDKSQNISKKG